ncbi:PucR family transcriptional regulator [Amycolatopsis pigmentata]|uniref:PucR family transcriptional regulator n=1 Tax=Amycolatopsis pigmentata TaxID=450801 RepID=A0ABW5FVZ0_9PSEU
MDASTERRQAGALVRALSRSSLDHVELLADAIVERVWSDVYVPLGPVRKDDLWRSCHDNLSSMLGFLNDAPAPDPGRLGTARATGVRRARQRCPLEWVQHAWQVGGQVMWEDFTNQTGALDPDELRQLVRGAGDVWQVVGEFTAEMAAAYHAVEQKLAGTPDPRVPELMDALLDGRGAEVATEVTRVLGLPSPGRYVVIVTEDDRRTVLRPLTRTLGLHGIPAEWRHRGGLAVGIAAVGGDEPRALADLLRPVLSGRTGLSPAVGELAGLPLAHRMAELAMHTIAPGASGVITLDDSLPNALLINSPELAQRLVDVTFGRLLTLPAAERDEMLDTAAAWISSAGSSVQAARVLYCHRNTVLNRLHRIHTLTGFDLTDTAAWSQVMLALSALRYQDSRTRA